MQKACLYMHATPCLTWLLSLQTLVAMASLVMHMLPAHDLVPNCSICKCPLLLYKRAFDPQKHRDLASHIEETFASHGYDPQWRYRMYDRRGPLPSGYLPSGSIVCLL